MKRSEMKQIIWEAGEWLSGEYPDDLYEQATEDILQAIEKAGMVPPRTPVKSYGDGDYYGGKLVWEPEDDTK